MIWILILTLTTMDNRGGVAVHSVPGFATEQSCMAAAKIYSLTMDRAGARAMCVPQVTR